MPDSLTILAVDTSMNACGVALHRADGKFFSRLERMERGQAEVLMPMIMDIVGQAGLTLQDVDRFAVTTGPGTFTGLRVGLATVRALSQATGKPVASIGTFDALEMGQAQPVCVLIETKRSDFYVRAPGHDDACRTQEELAAIIAPEWTLIGDAVDRAVFELKLKNPIKQILSAPLENLIALAQEAPKTGLPEPVYLRGADVSQTKKTPVNIV